MIKLMEDWKGTTCIGSNYLIGILSTDPSKPFDLLHPPLLLAKLKAYGFEDFAIGLMRSYFSDRRNNYGQDRNRYIVP